MTHVQWRKATFSGQNGSCVELAQAVSNGVWMRDSKLGDVSPTLHLTHAELADLIGAIKAGELGHLI